MQSNKQNKNTTGSDNPSSYTFIIPLPLPNNTFSISNYANAALGELKEIQSAFIDNSQNLEPLIISIQETNQNIVVMPASQMNIPLLINKDYFNINITTTGTTGQITFILYNTVLPAFINDTQPSQGGSVLSAVENQTTNYLATKDLNINNAYNSTKTSINTTDTNIATAYDSTNKSISTTDKNIATAYDSTNNSINTTDTNIARSFNGGWNALTTIPVFGGHIYNYTFSGSTTSSSLTIIGTTLIRNITIIVTSNATLSTAGIETINFSESSNSNFSNLSTGVYIGSSISTNQPIIINLSALFLIVTSGDTLTVSIGTPLSTGTIYVYIY